MIAFEVHLNGKKICTAGVGDLGVLSTIVTWRGAQPYQKGGPVVPEYLNLDVGGLTNGEELRWLGRKLKRGDVISIKLVDASRVSKPRERRLPDPAENLRRQKQYVRRMAKQFGWRIQT